MYFPSNGTNSGGTVSGGHGLPSGSSGFLRRCCNGIQCSTTIISGINSGISTRHCRVGSQDPMKTGSTNFLFFRFPVKVTFTDKFGAEHVSLNPAQHSMSHSQSPPFPWTVTRSFVHILSYSHINSLYATVTVTLSVT